MIQQEKKKQKYVFFIGKHEIQMEQKTCQIVALITTIWKVRSLESEMILRIRVLKYDCFLKSNQGK